MTAVCCTRKLQELCAATHEEQAVQTYKEMCFCFVFSFCFKEAGVGAVVIEFM